MLHDVRINTSEKDLPVKNNLHEFELVMNYTKFFKGRLFSKANFEVFIRTKKQTKIFFISALASKMGEIKK